MKSIKVRGKLLTFEEAKIMGVINVTPDSFYDGSRFNAVDETIKHVLKMVDEGVDIIDIGAASSRPGAELVSSEEEIKRLRPILLEIKKQFPDLVISLDTFHTNVAEFGIKNGVDIINDISAFEIDEKMLDFLSETKVPYIMMHMKGRPQNMQENTEYSSISSDILKFMISKLRLLHDKGIDDVIIDPGFGFGKSIEGNYTLLRELGTFMMLEKPILVGLSRKSMIYKYLGISPEKSLNATSALNLQSLLNGADLLRVHDVGEAKQMVALYKMLAKHN